MKDPTTIWAAQAAEERRRLIEADGATSEQRAEWADDATAKTAAGSSRATGRLAGLVGRIRRTLRR